MNLKYEQITIHQLNLMKHALGLDQTKAKPKRGKYTAYRNYYCSYGKNEAWESLVECGVAISRAGDPDIYPTSVFYHVSKEGMQLMEGILGFKIVEGE
jgi:hypothetical protein